MEIITNKISVQKLEEMAEKMFGRVEVDVDEVIKKIKKENFIHKDLSVRRWQAFSFIEQMANVGSEVGRALNWKDRDGKTSQMAFERGLELLDLTIADPKNEKRIIEIARVRETLCDYFLGKNQYHISETNWRDYFYSFGYAAALR